MRVQETKAMLKRTSYEKTNCHTGQKNIKLCSCFRMRSIYFSANHRLLVVKVNTNKYSTAELNY